MAKRKSKTIGAVHEPPVHEPPVPDEPETVLSNEMTGLTHSQPKDKDGIPAIVWAYAEKVGQVPWKYLITKEYVSFVTAEGKKFRFDLEQI